MNDLRHVPMDWRYRDVPDFAPHSAEGDAYNRYCLWLAAYLRNGNFRMNDAQRVYADQLETKSPDGIAITLADAMGYLIGDRDRLEFHARQDAPYSEVEKEERELWEMNYGSNIDPDIFQPFDDIKTPEAEYIRIREETREADALLGHLYHADIGIRPLLALAAKKCATDEDAERIVKFFYDTFNDSVSK